MTSEALSTHSALDRQAEYQSVTRLRLAESYLEEGGSSQQGDVELEVLSGRAISISSASTSEISEQRQVGIAETCRKRSWRLLVMRVLFLVWFVVATICQHAEIFQALDERSCYKGTSSKYELCVDCLRDASSLESCRQREGIKTFPLCKGFDFSARRVPCDEQVFQGASPQLDFQRCLEAEQLASHCMKKRAACEAEVDACVADLKAKKDLEYIFYFLGFCLLCALALPVLRPLYQYASSTSLCIASTRSLNSIRYWVLPLGAIAGLLIVTGLGALGLESGADQMKALQPLLGLLLIPTLAFMLSSKPTAVRWGSVLGGFALQTLFAIMAICFEPGAQMIATLGNVVSSFLGLSLAGSAFVFGDLVNVAPFAFRIMPTIFFFSAFVSAAYYLGVLQGCILGVARALRVVVGASTIEAVTASGNIFLGMSEMPLLIKPLLPKATAAELHCIMVCGYASVAGSVLAAYIGMGVQPNLLVLSCLMAAPTSLAMSKLSFPCPAREDDDVPHVKVVADEEELQPIGQGSESRDEEADREAREAMQTKDGSLVEALGNGASGAIALVSNIVAMLIAFLSVIKFVDTMTGWLFAMVGIQGITVSVLLGYCFAPLAFIIGVPFEECNTVGLLLGKKMVLNEFVAYSDLGALIRNRELGVAAEAPEGFSSASISPRAEIIATFALCGFANFASIGIQLGGLHSICPERWSTYAPLVSRAMFVGFGVSLVNACVAGLLFASD
eukprot:TRINITY_DN25564_c0_g1_i1.p1 TRINITY_DN25564_c0_g1~~TRINITY_DN25564_c0_g1_i1.p1  ORF type:complete len:733 (+),score=149.57 TRINITY_DN25564_c0_g1_i1:59-2257(+)